MSGYRYAGVKGTLLTVVGVIYMLQLFIVMPWFLGAVYRHEQSMWVWQEFLRESHKAGAGLGDIVLVGYLYLLFYPSRNARSSASSAHFAMRGPNS